MKVILDESGSFDGKLIFGTLASILKRTILLSIVQGAVKHPVWRMAMYNSAESTKLYEYCTYIVQWYVLRKLYDDAPESLPTLHKQNTLSIYLYNIYYILYTIDITMNGDGEV